MKKLLIFTGLLGVLIASSCRRVLEKDAKSRLTPEFLRTERGMLAGLDAAYAGTRTLWGTEAYMYFTCAATDECYYGVDANKDITTYSNNYNAGSGQVTDIWTRCYRYMNSANGVLQFGPEIPTATIPLATKNRMLAEAKFLRAVYHYTLVQFYRDITISTAFVENETTSAVRNSEKEVFAQIIKDLREAIEGLPASPKTTGVERGRATAAAAKHLLAKVYLTKATSGAKEAGDYEEAYKLAKDVIDNRASLALRLLPDFKSVFDEGNEYNDEVLWTVEHTINPRFNGPGNSSGADNINNHLFVMQYDQAGLGRSVEYGRPYARVRPTQYVPDIAFRDKINDTRYNKTFQRVWYCNTLRSTEYDKGIKWPNPLPPGAPAGAQPGKVRFTKIGDTAIFIPGGDTPNSVIARVPYNLVVPRTYNEKVYPTLLKHLDTKRPTANEPSRRSIMVFRLAETYLIAAEAAFYTSRPAEAVDYINAVRERAAFPTGNVAAMRIGQSDLSIDFILNERTRELYGEFVRWPDLVRTNKLIERVKLYNNEAGKNIKDFHVVRPIPRAQVDRVTSGEKYPNSLYFTDWN